MPTDEHLEDARDKRHEADKLLQARDYEGAITAFTEAISLNPDVIGAYNKRARAYRQLGRKGEAEADFEMVRALDRKRKLEREAAGQASQAERKLKRRLGRGASGQDTSDNPYAIVGVVLIVLIVLVVRSGSGNLNRGISGIAA